MLNTIKRSTTPRLVSKLSVFNNTRKMHIESIQMSWGRGNNYAYLVTDDSTSKSVIIDPAFPKDVLPSMNKSITKKKLNLINIVNTHHHHDHAGGNEEVKKNFNVPIIGGRDCQSVEQIPAHQSKFSIGDNIEVTALHSPCHTQDSICYYMQDSKTNQRAVFTGDTLFIAGCGRFFEGTAPEMYKALKTLGQLPEDTKVYPGHEYTRANLKFAKTIVDNDAIKQLDDYANKNEETTGAFTIGHEKKFNPFMMCDEKVVQDKVGFTDPIEVMAKLREMKNSF